jgi:hypothetical protein
MSLNSLPLAEDASEDIHIEDDDSKSIVVDADAGLGPSKKKVTRNKRKISKEPRPSKKSKPNPEKGNSFVENLLHTTDVTRMWYAFVFNLSSFSLCYCSGSSAAFAFSVKSSLKCSGEVLRYLFLHNCFKLV